MSEAVLSELRTELLPVPLARPWGHSVRELAVIAVRVRDSDGAEGHGFSWTPSIGGEAVQAMIEHDLAPFALGRPAVTEHWQQRWEHLHEAGGGGVTTIALAGLDLALWDLRAKRAGCGLPELLGRRHERQPAYGSGVNLHYSLDELIAQVGRWVDAGFQAVKVKIGKPELAEDLERLREVRRVLGPERALMVDANQRWDLEQATRAAEALQEFEPDWLEEPLRADDLAGHRELKRRVPQLPIALGENVHNRYRFADFLAAGAVDVMQPNVIRVGGITPFLELSRLAREHGAALAPHLLPELSAQLAFALPETTWVEDVEDAAFGQLGVLAEPSGVLIEDGWASGGPSLGLGLRFKERTAS